MWYPCAASRVAASSPMDLLTVPAYDLKNESDVEQKFLYPLLNHPSFLGIPAKVILTKRSMSALSFVDKSALPKNYVPDYLVFLEGYPVCVIEAKSTDVSAQQAIDEARLYAQLLNQNFPTKINPVAVVVGCNGRELLVGPVDSNECSPFAVSDLIIGSAAVVALRDRLGIKALTTVSERTQRSLVKQTFTKPTSRLPAQLLLDRVRQNVLAPYLTPIYEMFFRAEDPEEIQLILDQAYVDTAELREYDQVLHAMLRQVERALPEDYRTIQTDRRREYTVTPEMDRYGQEAKKGRLHLIIGSRGAGKSLFISRFFLHLLPEELKKDAVLCVIDFNRAPSSIENIEEHICTTFIETAENLKFDPFDWDGLNRVFSVEIARLKRGVLANITDDTQRQGMLANEVLKLSADKKAFALGLARSITGDANRPLIIAFDNVDRKESAQQLQIFQAAQWFRSETRAFALLTLRDVTFEHFKYQPPLDAFAQISNFYIRPPRFALVLQKRLKLALDWGLSKLHKIEQTSSTGLRFLYTKDQLGVFLQTVYDALFGGEQQVGRILDALAERDVRDALGMFARMLASGHFNADRVIKIGVGGKADISQDMLIKILMRADYRLYSEEAGFVRSIFSAPEANYTGNIFLSAEILGFFAQPVGGAAQHAGGFWKLEDLLSDMASMGFSEEEVRDRVYQLIKYKLLAYDGEYTEQPRDDDLIKITPGGFIHLRSLPHFIEYIASVALHAPLNDPAVARRIGDIWARCSSYSDLSFSFKHEVASMFAEYLVRAKAFLDTQNPLFRGRSREAEGLVRAITGTVNTTAPAAALQRKRHLAAAKARKERSPPPPRKRRPVSR